jgi:hypothetical protein
MLCQKCGHWEATVHRETTVFRQRVEEHLCSLCAGADGLVQPSNPLRSRLRKASGMESASVPNGMPWKLVGESKELKYQIRLDQPGVNQLEGLIAQVGGVPGKKSLRIRWRGQHRVVVTLAAGTKQMVLDLLNFPADPDRDAQVTKFWDESGIARREIFPPGVANPYSLRYRLSGDAGEIARLCARLLVEAYAVTPEAELQVSLCEYFEIRPSESA